jgi:hypothetical protein
MEKGSATVADEAHTLSDVESAPIQTNFKPAHKRNRSNFINSIGEESVLTEHSTRVYKTEHDEFQLCRRRGSDVVDCIGDKHDKVKDTEHMTKVDGTMGGHERPTTLDTNQTDSVEWNPEAQTETRSDRSSKDVTDTTPCTPPEYSDTSETGSR